MAECSFCFSEFSGGGQWVPYVLECTHSLCIKCLRNLSLHTCPICKSKISRNLAKKNFVLIDILARLKSKTVCSKCNCWLRLNTIRVCLTCMLQKDCEWMEEMDFMKKCAQFYLCGNCILVSHNTAEHSVINISEVDKFTTSLAVRCQQYLTENINKFNEEIEDLIGSDRENDVVDSFKKGVMNAMLQLDNVSSRTDKDNVSSRTVQRSDSIITSLQTAQNKLDKIVRVNRRVMNSLYKAIEDVKSSRRTGPSVSPPINPSTVDSEKNHGNTVSAAVVNNVTPTACVKITNEIVRKLKTKLDSLSLETSHKNWRELTKLVAAVNTGFSTLVVQIIFDTIQKKPNIYKKLFASITKLFDRKIMVDNVAIFPFQQSLLEHVYKLFANLSDLRKGNDVHDMQMSEMLSAETKNGVLVIVKFVARLFGCYANCFKEKYLLDFLYKFRTIKTGVYLGDKCHKSEFSLHCVFQCVVSYLNLRGGVKKNSQKKRLCLDAAREIYEMRLSITQMDVRREIEILAKSVL